MTTNEEIDTKYIKHLKEIVKLAKENMQKYRHVLPRIWGSDHVMSFAESEYTRGYYNGLDKALEIYNIKEKN